MSEDKLDKTVKLKEKNDEKDTLVPEKKNVLQGIPLLPLRNVIIFPNMIIPLFVGREKSIKALETAMSSNQQILLCSQKNPQTNNPASNEIFLSGTLSTILQLLKLPDGTVRILIEGKKRASIINFISETPFFMVECEEIKDIDDETTPVEIDALCKGLKEAFETYVRSNKKIPADVFLSISAINDPVKLVDTIAIHLTSKIEKRQEILDMNSIKDRLEATYALIQNEIEIIKVEQKIKSRIDKQIEKAQKEYYLNEQMDAIQKELGRQDGKTELFELEKKLKKIKNISKSSKEKVAKEIDKLKKMSPMSAEAAVVRNFVDWILTIPWDKTTKDNKDIVAAEKILNEDHWALEKVKERILEYLAVTTLVGKIKGSILCLCGPPGVGKTSLGESIARALGRKFVRVSLGGVRDEAEIRGHRRTYIGAMPGKIIQSMKKIGVHNPVFMLDEIDKMSMDFRGDPSSALLEVLDPEQNENFNDHYLEIDYDLSRVMFIATANSVHNIPRPLLDRMEVINLHGYTDEEKFNIATRFLISKQIELNGIKNIEVNFSDSAIYSIIHNYTKESGVRNLSRKIAAVCRKIAKEVVTSNIKKLSVTEEVLLDFLGPAKHTNLLTETTPKIGMVYGMAWTEIGGEVLTIETTVMPGSGKLELTGKLGEVMQESAKAAFTYVRSQSTHIGLDPNFYKKYDMHIHIPEGAIPKDGPSAGITLATCIASALLKLPISKMVAMTGEITLLGKILPIGGLKSKILAAHRFGIKTVIIPSKNKQDLTEIPEEIKKGLKIILVDEINDIFLSPEVFPKGLPLKKKNLSKGKLLKKERKNNIGSHLSA